MSFIGQTKIGEHKLYWGDCLEIMPRLEDKSIDMILADLPYGTTACKWDVIIPFNLLWEQYERIIKDNGAIVLFGTEPFSSLLRLSNLGLYKYDWIWEKNQPANISSTKTQPMKYHEIISVFYKNSPTFHKQMIERSAAGKSRVRQAIDNNLTWKPTFKELNSEEILDKVYESDRYNEDLKNPSTIIFFKKDNYGRNRFHTTQKPVALLEYLIKTYTNENEIVLDNVMGSGSTGEACINLDKKFIGIEKEEKYFEIAYNRLKDVYQIMGL